MSRKIPLFKIYWDKNDIQAVSQVIESGMNWATGPKIEEFENKLSRYVRTKYTLVFNSGTSALHALMMAYKIEKGDEVIVPSFTFIATANATLFVGAKSVFADIEEETFGLDPKDVERRITKRTKAILPLHYGGGACKIEELKKIAKIHNLLLIEDAAESLGARFKDRKVGSFGQAAIFSFCAPKVITTGEGGAVVTNSKKIYEELKLIRSHGRKDEGYFSSTLYMNYIKLGYNFRMSNITASLGLSQLKKINKIIKMRREKANYLNDKLSGIKSIILPNPPQDYFHIYQMYTIKVKEGGKIRDSLKDYLNKNGIGAKIYFHPVHLTSFYRKTLGYRRSNLPVTEKISNQVLTLPMYPTITKSEIDYMAKTISNFYKI